MRLLTAFVVSLVLALGACDSVPTTNVATTGGSVGADAGTGGAGGSAAGHAGTGGAAGGAGAIATGGAPDAGGAAGGGATGGAAGSRPTGGGGLAGSRAAGGAAGSLAAGGAGGSGPCDTNGDGLDDLPSCLTAPVTLRFVNATASATFDVYVTGASNPVTVGLAAYQVTTVGPVQAKLLDYEFRTAGVAPAAGEVNLLGTNRYTLVAYLDPTTTAPTLKTNSAAQVPPGGCGATGAQVDFGEFTSIASLPVAVLYAASGGTSWTPPFSPGLGVGEIFGSGCWNGGTTIQFGAGPSGASTPTLVWEAVSFANQATYQLLMTDDRIIEIDNFDHVANLPKL